MNLEERYNTIKNKVPILHQFGTDYKKSVVFLYRKKYFIFEIENNEVTSIYETKKLHGIYHEKESTWYIPPYLI